MGIEIENFPCMMTRGGRRNSNYSMHACIYVLDGRTAAEEEDVWAVGQGRREETALNLVSRLE